MKASIYIHVPWCRRRCPYCDFYFVVGSPTKNFFDALLKEWHLRKHLYLDEPGETLYFGGGTPSLLDPELIGEIIEFFIGENALTKNSEITIETNPEDVSKTFAHRLSRTRINRVSLGAQSLNDRTLSALGRKHSQSTIEAALNNLIQSGFHNISVDLILGMHGENIATVKNSLRYLSSKNINHLSTYLLTIEEKTKFYQLIKNGKMKAPDENKQVALYRAVQDILLNLGYIQYDISSFAKPNFFSRHNQVYWAFGNYIGLGPKAHSMRVLKDGSIERAENSADLSQWLSGPNAAQIKFDHLDPQSALKEALAFGLRNMASGICPSKLSARHGLEVPQTFFNVIETPLNLGWLENFQGSFRITQTGALFADAIMREILCC